MATRSKVLFGNRHLLAVSAQIADGANVLRPRELEEALDLAPSTVHRTLTTLTQAGLLERVPRQAGERDQSYERRSHPFWEAASHLHQEAIADEQDDSARAATRGGSGR